MKKLEKNLFFINFFISFFLITTFVFSPTQGLAGPPTWVPITGNLDTMVVHGEVYIRGVKINTSGYILGAFGPGGESDCRGKTDVKSTGFYYIDLLADINQEIISFKLYDPAQDQIYGVKETVVFQSDETMRNFRLNVCFPYYKDSDGDGYGVDSDSQCLISPDTVNKYTATQGGDRDDQDAYVYPEAPEICDGKDNNGYGGIDEGLTINSYYRDADKDGYGDPDSTTTACITPAGYVENDDDCDDTKANTHPLAAEICDGHDNNCDGTIDEGVLNTYYRDADGDGFGTNNETKTGCTAPQGYADNADDCDDTNPLIHRNTVWYKDGDGDGYGSDTEIFVQCIQPPGFILQGNDCDDTNPDVKPGALEVCDGKDNNCNGQTDEGVVNTYYLDADNDGYGDKNKITQGCTAPAGYKDNALDCDDTNFDIKPGVNEVCDGKDNNCNGQTDEGVLNTYYLDSDNDSYGDKNQTILGCTVPTGYQENAQDCDDTNPAIKPGANEVCDGKDNNCNDQIDEGINFSTDFNNCGKCGQSCQASHATSSCADANCVITACDSNYYDFDHNPLNGCEYFCVVSNNGYEMRDGVDNDCDGEIDENITVVTIFPDEKILSLNETFHFTVSGGAQYQWSSADEAIASVDGQGNVTGKGEGTTTIRVTDISSQAKAEARVTVFALRISPAEAILIPGKSMSVSVIGGTGPYTWSVVFGNDVITLTPDAAFPDGSKCTVIGQSEGTAQIEVADKNQIKAVVTARVYVLDIFPDALSLGLNQSQKIDVFGGVPGTSYVWKSSDQTRVSVDAEGWVKGIKEGEATITVLDPKSGAQASIKVTVVVVRLNPENYIMLAGQEKTIIASGGSAFTWSSSNETIAGVDQQGKVKALLPGTATITVTDISGVSAKSQITVVQMTLTPLDKPVRTGGTVTFTASFIPATYIGNVVWQSSDSLVATVDNQGKAKGIKAGQTIITARDTTSGLEMSSSLTVVELTLTPASMVTATNQHLQLNPSVLPANYAPQYKWTSDNTNVASVDQNGLVTTFSTGKVNVSVQDEVTQAVAICNLTIKEVKISPDKAVLSPGETINLTAQGGTSYTWKSLNEDIATVNNNGLVTATSNGTATITATDGESKAVGSAIIKVVSLRIEPGEAYIPLGSQSKLTAGGGKAPYTWTSRNTRIVVVQTGTENICTIEGKAEGVTNIVVEYNEGEQKLSAVATVHVVVLALSPGSLKLAKGNTAEIKVTGDIKPENISWSTDNSSIIELSQVKGTPIIIKGKMAGTTNIWATDTLSGAKEKAQVTVVEVKISPAQNYLGVTNSMQLTPSGGTTYTWSSNNTIIASVDGNGKVTGHKAGRATITATDTVTGAQGSAEVSVIEVIISPASLALAKNEIRTLLATGGCGTAYNWSSSNALTVEVDSKGKILTKAPGQVIITATDPCSGAKATSVVSVVEIIVSPSTLSLSQGASAKLQAKGGLSTYVWSSENSNIVSVDNQGQIFGQAAGTAKIFAEGVQSKVKGEAVITIVDVELDTSEETLAVGEEVVLKATGGGNYLWDGCQQAIAECTKEGNDSYRLKGISPGTMAITATDEASGAHAVAVINVVNVDITPSTARIGKGKSLELKARGGSGDYEWQVTNEGLTIQPVSGTTERIIVTGAKAGLTEVKVTDSLGIVGKAIIEVADISLVTGSSVYLTTGGTAQLQAQGGVSYVWESDKPEIAQVDQTGLILAKQIGKAVITVKDNKTYSTETQAETKATVIVAGLSILPLQKSLPIGGKVDLQVAVSPTEYTNPQLNWSTSNSQVAMVSSNGQVTAIGEGKATITVRDQLSKASARADIQVINIVPSTAQVFLQPQGSVVLEVKGGSSYTWVSDNTQIAQVTCQNSSCSQAKVLALQTGECQLKIQDASQAEATVSVKVVQISVNPNSASVAMGKTIDLTAQGGTEYEWFSSTSAIASVDNSGRVAGLSAGVVEIGAVDAVSGFSAKATIKVVSLKAEPYTLNLAINEGKQVKVFGGSSYIWDSDDEIIASVDASGYVVGLKNGATNITVRDVGTESTAIIPVTVVSVSVSPSEVFLTAGGQKSLVARGGSLYEWTSYDPLVATVSSNGLVQAVSPGDAVIEVRDVTQAKAQCVVHVVALTLTPQTASAPVGQKIRFSPQSTSTSSKFSWSSSNPSLVSIDQTGLATLLNSGTVRISVTDTVSGAMATSTVNSVKVTVTPKENVTTIGKPVILTASGGTFYQWSSSQPEIASVNEYGAVNALKGGTARITVTDTVSGALDTANIQVVQLDLQPKEASIGKGDSIKFTVSGGTSGSYRWSASDPSVTINQNQIAGFSRTGTFTITVYDQSGASVKATVNVIEITVTPANPSLAKGGTIQLKATGGTSYTWSSNNPNIVKVNNSGGVEALGAGTALITATDALTRACSTVTVKVVEVSIKPALVNLSLGQSVLLEASGGTYYTWESSNKGIATVSNGFITAEGLGGAVIKVTDITSGAFAQSTVNVYNLTPNSAYLKKGNTLQLALSGGEAKTWQSSDESVATVDAKGLVTGQKAGQATTTAKDDSGADLGSCSVTVVDLVITPIDKSIPLNGQVQLSVSGGIAPQGQGSSPVYQWTSSDSSIVNISQTGLAAGKKPGQAIITVHDQESGIETTTKVTVIDVQTSPSTLMYLAVNSTEKEITASGGTNYTFTPANSTIATLLETGRSDQRKVKGLTCGTTTLTVTDTVSGDKQVITVHVICVNITPKQATVAQGSNMQFIAQGGSTYEWLASQLSVAINDQGLARFSQAGDFEITVRDKASQSFATAQVTVIDLDIQEPEPVGLLAEGKSKQCNHQFNPSSYSGQVEWSSSNPEIATVSGNGLITGVAPGTVNITAKDSSTGAIDTITLTIVEVQTKPGELSLIAGGEANLTSQAKPSGYTAHIEWISDDSDIATVSPQGLVKAVGEGTVTIRARDLNTCTEGLNCAEGLTTVKVTKLAINPKTALIPVGKTFAFTASGGLGSYTWSSDNSAVAQADANSGVVKGLSAGQANITVEDADSLSNDTASVVVVAVSTDPASLTIAKGESKKLTAYAQPVGYKALFQWASQNQSVATVSADGLVTAKEAGNTNIILKDSLSGAVFICPVKVVGVEVSPQTAAIPVGDKLELSVSGGSSYIWQSNQPGVADVEIIDNKVYVTGLQKGDAVITATDQESKASGSMTIRVVEIEVTPTAVGLKAGANIQLQVSGGTPEGIAPQEDIAFNSGRSGYPHPMESDCGWGGGATPWDIVDGKRWYPDEWARGLAFTGGSLPYIAPCGWRQATINFGEPKTFNRVVVWHHGLEHVPNAYKIQYWDGANWVDIMSTTNGHTYLKYPEMGWSTPTENIFDPVTSSKVRIVLNNCDITHGWIYEFEVYYYYVERNYSWSSNNQSVAPVSESGLVYGLSAGKADIKVMDEASGAMAVCSVSVVGLNISEESIQIGSGKTKSITSSVLPSGYPVDPVWESKNPSVATVDNKGKLTGLQKGETTVTVKDRLTGAGDSVKIVVVNITLEPGKLTLIQGEEKTLKVSGGTSYEWSIIGTEGIVHFTSQGTGDTAAIEAGAKSGQVTVRVTDRSSGAVAEAQVMVVSVRIEPESASIALLKLGQTLETQPSAGISLTATGGASGQFTWFGDDEQGLIDLSPDQVGHCLVSSTGAGTGSVIITAKHESGLTFTAMVTIVAVSLDDEYISLGNEKMLTFGVSPNTYPASYQWEVVPSHIAMINENGFVKGLSTGSANITLTEKSSGARASSNITVVTMTIDPKVYSLVPNGATRQLTCLFSPTTYTLNQAQLTWLSSNSKVAGVDQNGLVTSGEMTGSATITAKDQISGATATAKINVINVQVTPSVINLAVNATSQLTASGGESYKWQSVNPDIAAVDQTGRVTGIKPGIAIIKVSDINTGIYAEATVKVVALSILPQDAVTLQINDTRSLSLDIQPAGYTASLEWSGSNTNIAGVSAQGVVTAKGVGSTIITVKDTLSKASATKPVSVEASLSKIYIEPGTAELEVKGSLTLTANGEYTDGTLANISSSVIWSTENENSSIGSVNQAGLFTAQTPGEVKVYATQGELKGEAVIKVKTPRLVGLTIKPEAVTLEKNGTKSFTLTGLYSDDSQKAIDSYTTTVIWQSDNLTAGEVNNNGLFQAKAPGEAKVTAAVEGIQGIALVTVKEASLQSIKITPPEGSLEYGASIQFKAEGYYSDGSVQNLTKSVTWDSSQSTVAGFSEETPGLLKASTKVGETRVTASNNYLKSNVTSVSVRQPILVSLRLVPESASLEINNILKFKVYGNYSHGQEQEETQGVTWKVADNQLGFIDPNGSFKALKIGTTYLEAKKDGIMAKAPIIIKAVSLTNITVTPETVSLYPQQTASLTVNGIYSDGSSAGITNQIVWEDQNTDVAKIETGGKLTAIKAGSCILKAKSQDGLVVSHGVLVNVSNPILDKIRLAPDTAIMERGESRQFEAFGLFSDNKETNFTTMVNWSIQNTNLGQMDETIKGLLHASSEQYGKTTLRAGSGNQSATATVEIKKAELETLQISPQNASLEQNQELQFTALGLYSDGTKADVTVLVRWSCDPNQIGEISKDGLFHAGKAGSAAINAVFGNINSNVAQVKVKEPVITQLLAAPSGLTTLELNQKANLKVTALYSDSHTEEVTNLVQWQLSDPNVGSISTGGLFTPANPGTTYLDAEWSDLVSNTLIIKVNEPALTKIQISPSDVTLPVGYEQKYRAIGTFSDGSTAYLGTTVIWSSSRPSVGKISQDGSFTGLTAGECQVHATAKGKQSNLSKVTITQDTPLALTIQPGVLFQAPSPEEGLYVSPISQYVESEGKVKVPLFTNTVDGISSWKILYSYDTDLLQLEDVSGTDLSPDVTLTPVSPGVVEMSGHIPSGSTGSGSLVEVQMNALKPSSKLVVPLVISSSLAGGEAVISIYAPQPVNLTSWNIILTYDTSLLSFKRGEKGTLIDDQGMSVDNDGYFLESFEPVSGQVNIAGMVFNTEEILMAQGTICRLSFNVLAGPGDGGRIHLDFVDDAGNTLLNVSTVDTTFVPQSPGNDYDHDGVEDSLDNCPNKPNPLQEDSDDSGVGDVCDACPQVSAIARLNLSFPQEPDNDLRYAYTSSAQVMVYEAPLTVRVSDRQQFVAKVLYSNDQTVDLTDSVFWWSDPEEVAVMTEESAGELLGLSQGSTEVFAKFKDLKSAPFEVKVLPAELVVLSLQPDKVTLTMRQQESEERRLTVTGVFSDGSSSTLEGTEVRWLSDDSDVVSVDPTGLILAQAEGTTFIKAISLTNESVTAMAQVRVVEAGLESISILPDNPTLQEGSSQQFTAIGSYDNDTILDITSSVNWSFEANSSLGWINNQGIFQAFQSGEGQIKAALGSLEINTQVVIVDKTPPAKAKEVKAVNSYQSVELTWSNPQDSDLQGSLILREEGSASLVKPQDGYSYNVGDKLRGALVVYKGINTTHKDTGLINGQLYTYSIFNFDEVPNYSSKISVSVLPRSPQVTALPTSHNFGGVGVGKSRIWGNEPWNPDNRLSVQNTGSDALSIESILSTNHPVFWLLTPSEFLLLAQTEAGLLYPDDFGILSQFSEDEIKWVGTDDASRLLVPGGSINLSVRFAPPESKVYNGKLAIMSNDPERPELGVDMAGFGLSGQPEIVVSPAVLDFGQVAANSQSGNVQTLEISNIGEGHLMVKSIFSNLGNPDDCSISGVSLPVEIEAGTSITVMIAFRPASIYKLNPGTHYLVVNSDDQDEPSVYVSLAGEGVPYLISDKVCKFYGSALLNGRGLPVGDVIYAFDASGVWCGSFTIVKSGEYGPMPVYGVAEGEAIELWVYDTDLNCMFKPTTDNSPTCKENQSVKINLSVFLTQEIPLYGGQNYFSFTVNNCYYDTPQPPTVPLLDNVNFVPMTQDVNGDGYINLGDSEILASINGLYDWVKSYDENGQHIYNPHSPQQSDLHYLAAGYGYEIKMKENAAISLSGCRADELAALKLNKAGKYLLGFWQNTVYYDLAQMQPTDLSSSGLFLVDDYDYYDQTRNYVGLIDIGQVWRSLGFKDITMRTPAGKVYYKYGEGSTSNKLYYIGPGCGYLIDIPDMPDAGVMIQYP